jgi:SAM-dependent methyltransferase
MDHSDHVRLLRNGVPSGPGVWADFGSGGGAFTLALADLLGPGSVIYSVDRDRRALERQARALRAANPQVEVHYLHADYTRPLALPPLDGVVMANSLHFQRDRDKPAVLQLVADYLKYGGRLIIVEYDTDRGSFWVPHPFSASTWVRLAAASGFVDTRKLASYRGRHLNGIYSALSVKPHMCSAGG